MAKITKGHSVILLHLFLELEGLHCHYLDECKQDIYYFPEKNLFLTTKIKLASHCSVAPRMAAKDGKQATRLLSVTTVNLDPDRLSFFSTTLIQRNCNIHGFTPQCGDISISN